MISLPIPKGMIKASEKRSARLGDFTAIKSVIKHTARTKAILKLIAISINTPKPRSALASTTKTTWIYPNTRLLGPSISITGETEPRHGFSDT